MNNLIWVTGKIHNPVTFQEGYPAHWTIQGIFDEEEDAVKACKTENDFVGPIPRNTELKQELEKWEFGGRKAYYPLLKKKE